MSHLGVNVPTPMRDPPRRYARIASVIWLAVSVPFFVLAYLYWNWPQSMFVSWRGWVFAAVAVACVLMATVAPPRWRIAVVGTRLRGWGRLV
jgi:hypothetical protein